MTMLFGDLETYSTIPIKHGVHAYAEKAEILLFAYAFDDGPVHLWDATRDDLPEDLETALRDAAVTLCFHNAAFDRTILQHCLPDLCPPVERWRDTMVMALAHSLPAGLGHLCEVLQVPTDMAKDKDGKRLIRLFCQPRPANVKIRRATGETHAIEWSRFCDYAKLDIIAMRECYQRVPKWNTTPAELDLWHLDQRINGRGVCIDLDLAHAAVRATDREQARLADQASQMTEGAVTAATQRDALLHHFLSTYGIQLPDLQKATVERLIEADQLPQPVLDLLAIRLSASSTSTAKYEALRNAVSRDGRLRGTLQFCGASRSGRWGGRTFQPQNLPRPTLKQPEINAGIEALKADCEDLVVHDVMELLSSAVRGTLVAAPGKKLVVSDLSAIEGRMLAWLAGEEWKIKAYAEGQDLYKATYAKTFGVPLGEINSDQRQMGKVLELACFAEDSEVLTDSGYKRIVDVQLTDKVWDGIEWVSHKGLVAKGVKKVVLVDGIKVTPSHQILVENSWMQAGQLAMSESILSLALATGSANLPWSASQENEKGRVLPTWWLFNALAGQSLIKSTTTTSAKGEAPVAMLVPRSSLGVGAKTTPTTRISALMTDIAAVFSTESLLVSIGVATPKMPDTRTTAAGGSMCTLAGAKTAESSLAICSPWMGGMTLRSKWIASMLTRATCLGICGSSPNKKTSVTSARFKPFNQESLTLSERLPTYDLAYCGPRNRFTVRTRSGHLVVHNCGYGGGVGAFHTFATAFNIDLEELAVNALPHIPDDLFKESERMRRWAKERKMPDFGLSDRAWAVCDAFKTLWRQAHPHVVTLWSGLEETFRLAAASKKPDEIFRTPQGLPVQRVGTWVRLRLPSGRYMCYPDFQDDGKLCYRGVHQFTRKWTRIDTYGGKLAENITQAAARDVLCHGMQRAEAAGYAVVLHVHDELITETPDTAAFSAEGLSALMASNPPWASDLPLAAEGFETYRYRK